MPQVAAVPEDVGIAGALQAIAHHLTSNDILVSIQTLSSFLVLSLGLFTAIYASSSCRLWVVILFLLSLPVHLQPLIYRHNDAVVMTMLWSVPVSGPTESGSWGGKDKIKKPRCYNIIGLDPSKQFLLHIATG
jgi:translation initiation factor eIF-2B subunit gamma